MYFDQILAQFLLNKKMSPSLVLSLVLSIKAVLYILISYIILNRNTPIILFGLIPLFLAGLLYYSKKRLSIFINDWTNQKH